MIRRLQILCASSGFALVFCISAAIGVCRFIPPMPAYWGAEQVSAFYQDHHLAIRLGMVLMMFGAVAIAPYAAAISTLIRRIDSRLEPLASTQMICSACNIVAIFVPVFFFLVAAYRPERSPEITQTLNDLAWVPFIMNVPPAVLQGIVVGAAILADKRAVPLMPRWTAYVNFWMAFLLMPAAILIFFKTGPFAWHGLITFWIAGSGYIGWYVVMSTWMIKAARRQDEAWDLTPPQAAIGMTA